MGDENNCESNGPNIVGIGHDLSLHYFQIYIIQHLCINAKKSLILHINTTNVKIGLFFGSFNPIHIGHTAIANYIVEYSDVDEVWFVVSPHNPLKKKATLLNDTQRLELVDLAIGDDKRFRSSNIEFTMPKPSYTIDTLTYLTERYPNDSFTLIAGMDNLDVFTKWKNYEQILENYTLAVYPRPGCGGNDLLNHNSISVINAPQMEISSSFIRQAIKEDRNVSYFLPKEVWSHIDKYNLYK